MGGFGGRALEGGGAPSDGGSVLCQQICIFVGETLLFSNWAITADILMVSQAGWSGLVPTGASWCGGLEEAGGGGTEIRGFGVWTRAGPKTRELSRRMGWDVGAGHASRLRFVAGRLAVPGWHGGGAASQQASPLTGCLSPYQSASPSSTLVPGKPVAGLGRQRQSSRGQQRAPDPLARGTKHSVWGWEQ